MRCCLRTRSSASPRKTPDSPANGRLPPPLARTAANGSSARSAVRHVLQRIATVSPPNFRCRGRRLSTPIRKSRVKIMSKCGAICEVFSRVCGYFRPVSNWNKGKQEEFKERKIYEVKKNARKNPDGVSSDGV